MLDHVAINVTDLERSKRFYTRALEPLGYSVLYEAGGFVGLGAGEAPDVGLAAREPSGGGHVAFAGPDRSAVDAFYEAALAAGGQDNGPPGVRSHYHEHYYAAFVLDPDGNNIEAVCHRPESA
jgi:catechol 2,3-dioxygenase-like lactoylglutathione lyase family enzyme